MLKLLFALALVAGASVPLAAAGAHEGQKVACDETSMNALRADIQADRRWRGEDNSDKGNAGWLKT